MDPDSIYLVIAQAIGVVLGVVLCCFIITAGVLVLVAWFIRDTVLLFRDLQGLRNASLIFRKKS